MRLAFNMCWLCHIELLIYQFCTNHFLINLYIDHTNSTYDVIPPVELAFAVGFSDKAKGREQFFFSFIFFFAMLTISLEWNFYGNVKYPTIISSFVEAITCKLSWWTNDISYWIKTEFWLAWKIWVSWSLLGQLSVRMCQKL